MAVLAHPAHLLCGITHPQRISRNIFGDHSACANERVSPYIMPAHDGGICAYGCSPSHMRFCILVLAHDRASWINDIGEHHRRTEKNIIVTGNTGINRNVILHFDITSQHNFGRDHYVLPDVAAFAYHTARHNMRKVPYLSALPYG